MAPASWHAPLSTPRTGSGAPPPRVSPARSRRTTKRASGRTQRRAAAALVVTVPAVAADAVVRRPSRLALGSPGTDSSTLHAAPEPQCGGGAPGCRTPRRPAAGECDLWDVMDGFSIIVDVSRVLCLGRTYYPPKRFPHTQIPEFSQVDSCRRTPFRHGSPAWWCECGCIPLLLAIEARSVHAQSAFGAIAARDTPLRPMERHTANNACHISLRSSSCTYCDQFAMRNVRNMVMKTTQVRLVRRVGQPCDGPAGGGVVSRVGRRAPGGQGRVVRWGRGPGPCGGWRPRRRPPRRRGRARG
jgi:hypothetical protein